MLFDRPDLDGLRLRQVGGDDVWLVYHGRRHKIASPSVSHALFMNDLSIEHVNDIEAISLGPDLNEGTCLIRSDHRGDIYLLTGSRFDPRLHRVTSWNSFVEFHFAIEAVRTVPDLLVDAIELGRTLSAANDRAQTRG